MPSSHERQPEENNPLPPEVPAGKPIDPVALALIVRWQVGEILKEQARREAILQMNA